MAKYVLTASDEMDKMITRLAAKHDTDTAELLRRAIIFLDYLTDAEQNDKELVLRDRSTGAIERIAFDR